MFCVLKNNSRSISTKLKLYIKRLVAPAVPLISFSVHLILYKLTFPCPPCPPQMIIRLQKEVQDLKEELAIATGEQRTEALTEEELLQ